MHFHPAWPSSYPCGQARHLHAPRTDAHTLCASNTPMHPKLPGNHAHPFATSSSPRQAPGHEPTRLRNLAHVHPRAWQPRLHAPTHQRAHAPTHPLPPPPSPVPSTPNAFIDAANTDTTPNHPAIPSPHRRQHISQTFHVWSLEAMQCLDISSCDLPHCCICDIPGTENVQT